MKTSKIIFITLLSSIAIIILVVMISLRLNGQRWSEYDNKLKVNKKPLQTFSVLCIDNSDKLTVTGSETSYIEVSTPEKDATPVVDYTTKGDTLMLTGIHNAPNSPVFVKIYISKEVKKIKLENSDIMIGQYNSDNLSLNLASSKAYFLINKVNSTRIGTLQISARNISSVTLNSMIIDTLGVVLQNSTVTMAVSANTVSGTLSDRSKLFINQPGEISLKRDPTSRIFMYN